MRSLLEPPLTDAGHDWDALRIPDPWGRDLLRELVASATNLDLLGPVAWSEASDCTYWLISTGTTPATWPACCRLLSRGNCLALPGPSTATRAADWLFRPHDPRLTGTTWLAATPRTHALARFR
ncbi:hypothetical protein [Streptacidiphilus cavernicola]|uniref:Uncharacterized protein n=1 Tax=Streptacidiphilus cavernicola TaxID=3342716 RepID=A0ABV6VRF7_9ACTN